MHKCSRVACSQFESHLAHKMDFVSLNQSLTKRALESVLKAQKCVRELVELATSKGGGGRGIYSPFEKLAIM